MPLSSHPSVTPAVPFHLNYDMEELQFPQPRKMTAREVREIYDRICALGFVAIHDPERPEEPITMLIPLGSEIEAGPRENWNWDSVKFIGAGSIYSIGEWDFEVRWGYESAEKRFGRSFPEDGAEHCRAEDQVRKDFQAFLASTE